MASPFSGWVLGTGALLTAPALHQSLVLGTLPATAAATRFAVAVALVWVGVSLLASLVEGTSARESVPEPVPGELPAGAPPAVTQPARPVEVRPLTQPNE